MTQIIHPIYYEIAAVEITTLASKNTLLVYLSNMYQYEIILKIFAKIRAHTDDLKSNSFLFYWTTFEI